MAEAHEEVLKMLVAAQAHMGTKHVDHQMRPYIWRRRLDGINIIDIAQTWEKIQLAARVIVTVDPADVIAISARPYAQRAVLKYATYTGAQAIAGRYTPGTFTNQITKQYREPRLLIVTDPRVDHQPIREASYANIPVIAFTDSDSPMAHVDIAIPANNKVRGLCCCLVAARHWPPPTHTHTHSTHPTPTLQGRYSIGVLYYLLAREVLRLKGMDRSKPWDVPVDLFFYRDPEELKALEDTEKAAGGAGAEAAPVEEAAAAAPTYEAGAEAAAGWDGAADGAAAGWTGEGAPEAWGATVTA